MWGNGESDQEDGKDDRHDPSCLSWVDWKICEIVIASGKLTIDKNVNSVRSRFDTVLIGLCTTTAAFPENSRCVFRD